MQLVTISSGTPFPFVCAACGVIRHTAHSAQRGRTMANLDGPAFASFHCARCAKDAMQRPQPTVGAEGVL